MYSKKFDAQINYGWGLTLDMTGKAPAVNKRIFNTLSDAQSFADDYNDCAVEGLILSVVADNSDNKNGAYFIKSIKKNANDNPSVLVKIGSDNNSNNNNNNNCDYTYVVNTYEEALELATNKNIGQFIYVNNTDNSTPYIISGENELLELITNTTISSIENKIEENEFITSAALNDLNSRIIDNKENISSLNYDIIKVNEEISKVNTDIKNTNKNHKNDITLINKEILKINTDIEDSNENFNKDINIIEGKITNLNKKINTLYTQNITYAKLKDMRDNGQLTANCWYRIIDYETIISGKDVQSAGYPFDIIVMAINPSNLSENAYAAKRENSYSFSDSNLNAWKLKYHLDNDTSKFNWANENGKGVIWEMEDEHGNKCGYDFKNIQFKRYKIIATKENPSRDECYFYDRYVGLKDENGNISPKLPDGYTIDFNDSKYFYTFSYLNINIVDNKVIIQGIGEASSIKRRSYFNEIKKNWKNGYFKLSNNVFCLNSEVTEGTHLTIYPILIRYNTLGYNSTYNTFYETTYGSTGTIDGNTFHDHCTYNILADLCNYNSFGNNCSYNTFWYDCSYNTLGNNCDNNSFGDDCHYNTLGNNCHNNSFKETCSNNSFGNNCSNNSFGGVFCYRNSFGNNCNNNSFGGYFRHNLFGNDCNYNLFEGDNESNSFGNGCWYNSFGIACIGNSFGNGCQYNSFGNFCKSNSFGDSCSSNTLGNNSSTNSFGNVCYDNSFGNHCESNSFGNDCQYNDILDNVQHITVFEGVKYVSIGSNSGTVQYAQVLNGTSGSDSSNKLQINFATGKNYTQVAGQNSSGELKIWVPADLVQ